MTNNSFPKSATPRSNSFPKSATPRSNIFYVDSEDSNNIKTTLDFNNDLLTKITKDLTDLNNNFEKSKLDTEKKLKEFNDSIIDTNENLDDKMDRNKISVIESLGMFVALFTFISVDFQVFKSYRNPIAIGSLTAILVGSIFLFIVVFDHFIKKVETRPKKENENNNKLKNKDYFIISIIIISVVLICGGLFMFSKTKPENITDNNEQIKKEILILIDDDIKKEIKNSTEPLDDLKTCLNISRWLNPKCFEK